jgi:hypothetical protein
MDGVYNKFMAWLLAYYVSRGQSPAIFLTSCPCLLRPPMTLLSSRHSVACKRSPTNHRSSSTIHLRDIEQFNDSPSAFMNYALGMRLYEMIGALMKVASRPSSFLLGLWTLWLCGNTLCDYGSPCRSFGLGPAACRCTTTTHLIFNVVFVLRVLAG